MATVMTNERLRADILQRIEHDLGGVVRGGYLQRVRCPSCDKREAFISVESPWVIKCGRESKCGLSHHVKDEFPDLFNSWSERYAVAPTSNEPANPNAVADAYLQYGRGFNLNRIQGWYRQENYYDAQQGIGSATVRFDLPGGYWERLIDKPERFGKQKARFTPGLKYAGTWWQPPQTDWSEVEEIWLVEGIFDAIAHHHHGHTAVALFSCNNYPAQALQALAEQRQAAGKRRPVLIWSLDGDAAGKRYTLKFVQRARKEGWDCTAAQVPLKDKRKQDWNDLHQSGQWDNELDKCRYTGQLHIAKTATEKALLIHNRHGYKEFPFEFRKRTYWFKLDVEKYQKAIQQLEDADDGKTSDQLREEALQQCGGIQAIANCHPVPLYYQANAITDEAWYYYRIEFPHDGPARKNTFTGGQLASASEFKKRLLHVAPGAIWEGSSGQLDRLLRDQLSHIKTVETIDFIGYAKEHSAWVFGNLAVANGQVFQLNEEDFFEMGRAKSIKTLSQSATLTINANLKEFQTDWVTDLIECFGVQGLIGLAFWTGSLFAEHIRATQKSFPFLEITGEAGAGKSTLIEFLWKLAGRRDYEGFDPSKATTAARARNFAQTAGLPVVLIESDREDKAHAKQFDWDELKTAYNGRSVRSRGVKNSGNETYEPPFRGTIVIAQNAGVMASEAVLQRIVHLHFTRAGQTPKTKTLAERLERTPIDAVSGFILHATQAEDRLLPLILARTTDYEQQLMAVDAIRSHRIAKNHAQLMACLDALGPDGLALVSAEHIQAARNALVDMAAERQQAINADHPVVQEFWEAYDYLEGMDKQGVLNHYKADVGEIAINLRHFEALCGDRKLRTPDMSDLKKHLRSSRTRKFIEANRAVRSASFLDNRTLRCWVFEKPRGYQ